MAGAILEHKKTGHPVYLVLLTNGLPSPYMMSILNGTTSKGEEVTCPWHKVRHDFNLSPEQMIEARNAEFDASSRKLGVDGAFKMNITDSTKMERTKTAADYRKEKEYQRLLIQIKEVILDFEAKYPGASHKMVSGEHDFEPQTGPHPAHLACWDAARALRDRISKFGFYRVYVYSWPKDARKADSTEYIPGCCRAGKAAALNEYKVFEPEIGRFAFGYHSVGALIDEALKDDSEYEDLLP